MHAKQLLTAAALAAALCSGAAPVYGLTHGTVRPELVGRWCRAGGASWSLTCFTLLANGTFVYRAERADRDAGHWLATATSITAYSVAGPTHTYRLTRANDPRTGDPQLCLDGSCFTTATAHPIW